MEFDNVKVTTFEAEHLELEGLPSTLEEITEVEEAISDEDQASIEEEFGDVLFVITNLMRFFNVHPEVALHRTNEKFVNRFKHIEKRLTEKGMSLEEATLEEMDKYWEEAKRKIGRASR